MSGEPLSALTRLFFFFFLKKNPVWATLNVNMQESCWLLTTASSWKTGSRDKEVKTATNSNEVWFFFHYLLGNDTIECLTFTTLVTLVTLTFYKTIILLGTQCLWSIAVFFFSFTGNRKLSLSCFDCHQAETGIINMPLGFGKTKHRCFVICH